MITLLIRYWYLAVIAALVAFVGIEHMRGNIARTALYKERAERADERTRAAQAAQKAEQEARAEESRRQEATRKVVTDAHTQLQAVQQDADTARTDGERMRQRIAALERAARSAASNPAAPTGSKDQQGSDPIRLFAELSGGADALAEIYARVADSRRVTAQACERASDALTPKP